MRNICLVFSFLLVNGLLFSQNQIYTEVKILTDQSGIVQLAKLGLAADEGWVDRAGGWTTVLSQSELDKVKDAGFRIEILHKDYIAWIKQRNIESKKKTIIQLNDTYPVPQHFEQGSMGGYYTLEEVENELDSMRFFYPNLISVKAAAGNGNSVQGRPLYFVRISDNPDINQDKPRIFFNALTHAREPVGMQQMFFFMWYLLENYYTSEEIQYLVDNLEIYFLPVVNPDGYQYNDSIAPDGGGMWRKNRKHLSGGQIGVDLNRNFGYKWGYDDIGSSPYPEDETYRGPNAFSEPETQIVRDFCIQKNFRLAMNYHTYANYLMYPLCYLTELTPDSTLELTYADFFTRFNGYVSGVPGQILYNTNGDAMDWEYGEQTTKPKIQGFSTEIGNSSDGFWAPPDRIIPLSQENIYPSLMMAHFALRYAETKNTSPIITSSRQGYFKFDFTRYGMDSLADYTISLEPLDPSQIIQVGPLRTISNPIQFQTCSDSISYVLSPDLTVGSEFGYILNVDNGMYVFHDTVMHYFGTPVILLTDDCSNMTNWTSNKWNITHLQYHSPDACITDSPYGNYSQNANFSVTTINDYDVGDSPVAVLEFWAKWAVEKGFDYVQVKVSDNNGATWTSLQGNYTHPGTQNQVPGQPVYDGMKYNWIKEEILLKDYSGKHIKVRFTFVSDGWANYDGFYFDDVILSKIDMTTGISNNMPGTGIRMSDPVPNPAVTQVNISYSLPEGSKGVRLVIRDSRSIMIKSTPVGSESGIVTIDVKEMPSGIYFYDLEGPNGNSSTKKLIILR